MPPTPPSTTSSSAGHSPPDPQFRVVRKRNRVPLSCGPCRHRKLKCNRGHPCDNCIKRGDTASCTYASPGSRKKSSSGTGANGSPDDMQNRIDRLEGLILSLMTNGAQSAGPAAAQAAIANTLAGCPYGSSENSYSASHSNPESIREEEEEEGDESEVEKVAKSIGVMKMDNNRTIFASEAHWYAILGEIAEVKNYFNEHKKQYEEQLKRYKASRPDDTSSGTAFLFGGQKPATQADILARFPNKSTADILVARYFNTYDPGIHIIHGPTFQKQYDQHWLNPKETPVIWLGLVFAMMCIALQSYSRAGDEPPEYKGKSWDMSSEYRHMTAQCLVTADITQPVSYMLETLILHVYADYARSRDAEAGVMVGIGIIVRLAMRMGLHRDSRPYPSISVFQGEMRRRVWAVIRCLDLLFSAQAGLPPIVRTRDTNTETPRNLYDDELFEEMDTLPPSRPETEATPTLFLINRTRLIYKLGEAVELTVSLTCADYGDLLKVDQDARELHEAISPHLKMRSIDESARDPSTLIMQRFTLELLFLKIIVTLHRKCLAPARTNPKYAQSRRLCIEACMTMLQHQATLHRECQPGGRLRNVKWFISSLTTVDFLLAAMIVAAELYHMARAERHGRSPSSNMALWGYDRRDEMLDAIETAVAIWADLKDQSMEAYKAHATLSVMLTQLKQHRTMRHTHSSFSSATGSSFSGSRTMDENVAPEHSAAMTLEMLSTGGVTPGSANMFDTRYAASIPNILNDNTGPPAGLTPSLSSPGDTAPSPFSNLFAGSIGLQNMDIPNLDNTNFDWGTFDSFLQGSTSDAMPNFFPMDMNIQTAGVSFTQSTQMSQEQQPPTTNAFAGDAGAGVFMGVS
ncbi:uncharacterized protein EI97DRAFT_249612 [Westerdykella ornata]|uniref:Zn(2)-C6 fungal-type domain-containing protein n=1 Tax=Westerdykella ornata TaxID=318751 RepID=A0A6A6JPF9_WESOR|nr:uncharacterized protein EI97DRAFT_249612 [Westerdykella ornata]KAF2278277.1 hypothetical protein EI97DRAFT_249612 [Westerdykella ornata]